MSDTPDAYLIHYYAHRRGGAKLRCVEASLEPRCPEVFDDDKWADRNELIKVEPLYIKPGVLIQANADLQERENADLRSDIERHVRIASEQATEMAALREDLADLERQACTELAELRAKLEAAQRAIKEHNADCVSACKARYEGSACAYRNADGSSRYGNKRCHDCPENHEIDAAMQEGK